MPMLIHAVKVNCIKYRLDKVYKILTLGSLFPVSNIKYLGDVSVFFLISSPHFSFDSQQFVFYLFMTFL